MHGSLLLVNCFFFCCWSEAFQLYLNTALAVCKADLLLVTALMHSSVALVQLAQLTACAQCTWAAHHHIGDIIKYAVCLLLVALNIRKWCISVHPCSPCHAVFIIFCTASTAIILVQVLSQCPSAPPSLSVSTVTASLPQHLSSSFPFSEPSPAIASSSLSPGANSVGYGVLWTIRHCALLRHLPVTGLLWYGCAYLQDQCQALQILYPMTNVLFKSNHLALKL